MEEVNIAPKNTTKSDLEKLSVEDAGSQSIEATPAPTESKDDEKQYPKRRKVIPIMAACYLSLFLIALVSIRTQQSCGSSPEELGSHHHLHSHSSNHGRVPLGW